MANLPTDNNLALADLREVVRRLLDALDLEHGPTVDLAADHYWQVGVDDAFDLSREPPIGVGQLSDDVETIREILARENGEVLLSHDLEHVAHILLRFASLGLTPVTFG